MSIRPSASVRHAEVDGCRVLLDLNTESYRVLDPVASAMWAVLVGERDWPEERQALADLYEVQPEVLDSDLARFEADCVAQNILEETAVEESHTEAAGLDKDIERVPTRSRKWLPLTLRAISIFYKTRHSLKHAGFGTTYKCYARMDAAFAQTGLSSVKLRSAVRSFGQAEHFFLAQRAPNDCLVRSLSLFRFLREQEIPAEHVIGVCRMPFQAHAWVEYCGKPVLDEAGHSGRFVALARLAATPLKAVS